MPAPSLNDIKAATQLKVGVLASTWRRILTIYSQLWSIWQRVQVGNHGAYTSRRARALDRYVYSTQFIRALAVCVLTPLPTLVFVVVQELVPLESPTAGWKTNYRWFVRAAIIFMVLTLSYIQQGVIFLSPLKVSWKQTLVVTLCATGAYFGVLVGVSDAWIFPIPFSCVLTTGVFTCLFFGIVVVVVGWSTIINTPQLLAHARILKRVLVVETVIVFVYPAFNAAFRVLHGVQQVAFLVVLFLLRMIMRFVMEYAVCRDKEGVGNEERWRARLPELIVFSTELFHVLYLTACLQSQQITVWLTIGISLFDAISSVVSARRLLKRPKMMLVRMPLSQSRRESAGSAYHSLRELVLVARPPLAATQSTRTMVPTPKPKLLSSRSLRAVVPMPGPSFKMPGPIKNTKPRSRPTLPLRRSHTIRKLAPKTSPPRRATIDFTTAARLNQQSSLQRLSTSRRLNLAISATVAQLKLAKRSSSRTSRGSLHSDSSQISHSDRSKIRLPQPILRLTTDEVTAEMARLETLSKLEYCILVEYVKCIIPAMYGIFQFLVAHLPNAVYYPAIANATQQDLSRMQVNMAVFVAMKIVSLTTSMVLLRRRLRFSALHQLAFVLETAADDIQAKLAMFIPYCFFFFLEHNGVDYSFQFTWARND